MQKNDVPASNVLEFFFGITFRVNDFQEGSMSPKI